MHDDLVEEPRLEDLGGGRRPEHPDVAVAGRFSGGGDGVLDAAGDERHALTGLVAGAVGEHEDGSAPGAAVNAGHAVVPLHRDVVPAAAGEDGAGAGPDGVGDGVRRVAVAERPVHAVLGPGDEAVQGHGDVPGRLAHGSGDPRGGADSSAEGADYAGGLPFESTANHVPPNSRTSLQSTWPWGSST